MIGENEESFIIEKHFVNKFKFIGMIQQLFLHGKKNSTRKKKIPLEW